MRWTLRSLGPCAVALGLIAARAPAAEPRPLAERLDCASLTAPVEAPTPLSGPMTAAEREAREALGVPAGACVAKAAFGNRVYAAFRSGRASSR